MKIIRNLGALLLFSILVLSCSSDTPLAPESQNPPADNDLSKFSKIQVQVFTPRCATSGCHAGANPPSNLNLSSGQAYGALINVNSVENPAMKRVLPGDASQSLLIKKLKGENTSVMPAVDPVLSSAVIDSIAKWINTGALNN